MNLIKNIFLNSNENRLFAGWRILIFIIFFILTSNIISHIALSLVGDLEKTESAYWVFRGIIVIVAGSLVVWTVRKYIDKKTFISLGLRLDKLAVIDFIVGLIISALMIGLIFIILIISGLLEIKEISWNGGGISAVFDLLLWFFGIGLAVGWSEELVFRGYLLQNIKDGMGLFWAVLISCLLYGLLHMSNPNSTILSGFLIVVFGYLRIFGWLRSGQLWLSMGMHAGWDFFQGPTLGFAVSGINTESLFKPTISGPDWITGGPFGPEAGIVVIPALFLGFLMMYLWTKKRENISWKK